MLPVDQVCATWDELPTADSLPEEEGDALGSTARVAHNVIEQVYFASGAIEHEEQPDRQTAPAPASPNRFAELALPLLESYGRIPHPAVVHQIVETLNHISDAFPKRALLAAMHAATNDESYAHEPLGLEAVLSLIRRYLADHRNLILGDIECITAIRMLLESFVRIGWDQAIQFTEAMDEIFR